VKYALIEAEKVTYPVSMLCRVIGVARSGYYRWLKSRDLPDRRFADADDDDEIRREIRQIHRSSRGSYGRPRLHAELRARGRTVGAKRLRRLMVEEGLRGRGRRPRLRRDRGAPSEPSENLLDRNFEVNEPNRVWLGDITFIEVAGVFWYLAAIIDLYSRRVVGWHLANHADAGIVVKALRNAVKRRRPGRDTLLFHSDRGFHYRCWRFRGLLKVHGIAQSMSRHGNCWDNAPMESFFASVELECLDLENWTSGDQLHAAIARYIHYYNNRRSHTSLGYRSPSQYENAA
jgi:putative transposase